MDENFIELVDNIYETKFIDRIFLNEANYISKDSFLDSIAGSLMGNLFGGALEMFPGETEPKDTEMIENNLLKDM